MIVRPFNYESLSYQQRESIHTALAETTVKHIRGSGGLFEALPFDPAANPSQMLEVTHLQSAPSTFDEIHFLADTASQGRMAPHIREYLANQKAFTSAARQLLREGVNIFPMTAPHLNIADVAYWSSAWAEHLEDEHWQQQNGLVISRGVTTIGAFGMAASEVVEKAGHVFMSFPRTQTIENLADSIRGAERKLDMKHLIDHNNRQMRSEVKAWLSERIGHSLLSKVLGKTLNIAEEGKTTAARYDDDHKIESMRLGKIAPGTVSMVKNGLVLPIVILDDGDEPFIELGPLTRVSTENQAVALQLMQRESIAKRLGLKPEAIELEALTA